MQEPQRTKGRPETSEAQVELILSLDARGLSPAQIRDADGVEVGLTTVYSILKLNKKATPDRAANSLPPDMDSGGVEPSKFTASA